MHHKLGAILILLALVGCAGRATAPGDSLTTEGCNLSEETEVIAAELRSLRTVKGHFDGGTWNDDVDKWMGRKHEIMIQLGSRLGAGDCNKGQIIQLLGSPDLTAREGDGPFDSVSRSPEFEKPAAGPYELLIYHWRGTHDFLYFTSQGETVLNSGWWYAGE